MPEIHRIDKQRKTPNAIRSAGKKKRVMLDSIARKEENERRHSKPGSKPYVSERNKHIVRVEE
jgi:WD repeat and SOF domain-containing protein 1